MTTKPLNEWDIAFKKHLESIETGKSQVFYYMSGSRKGMASKEPDGKIKWFYPNTNVTEIMTVDECVEKNGYS